MTRALAAAGCLVCATAFADPAPRVEIGGARTEAGAAMAVGTEQVGLAAWIEKPDLNRTASATYVYRWRGGAIGTDRFRPLLRSPNFSLFLRSSSAFDFITQGGWTVGMELGLGLGARVGPSSGAFSLVATPLASVQGFWLVSEGVHGLSARVPLGGEVGIEGNVQGVLPFAVVRSFADLWPHRPAAYRTEALVGLGFRFDLPGPRKPGEPSPPGPWN